MKLEIEIRDADIHDKKVLEDLKASFDAQISHLSDFAKQRLNQDIEQTKLRLCVLADKWNNVVCERAQDDLNKALKIEKKGIVAGVYTDRILISGGSGIGCGSY